MITFVPRPSRIAASPVPPRRHLLGIHAILAGTTFAKADLLDRLFLAGIDLDRVEVDLYLVAGGGAGGIDTGAAGARPSGGAPGGVRLVQHLRLADIANTTSIQIGAGAIGATNHGAIPTRGGDTVFGMYRAFGGMSGSRIGLYAEAFRQISDVPLSAPSLLAAGGGPASAGPGVGASMLGTAVNGGESGAGSPGSIVGGRANISPADLRAGRDADPESLSYGSGGSSIQLNVAAGGADYGSLHRGGRPGGGGGARSNAQGAVTGQTSGPGGDGIIRLAVYEWRAS